MCRLDASGTDWRLSFGVFFGHRFHLSQFVQLQFSSALRAIYTPGRGQFVNRERGTWLDEIGIADRNTIQEMISRKGAIVSDPG